MFLNMHVARDTVPTGRRDISLDKAELISVFLECSLYGVEALTFVATVYLLLGAKRTKTLAFKFAFVIFMFMFNTIHIGAVFRRALNAFVGTPDDPLPDPAAYLGDLAGFLYRFTNIIIVIQFFMHDILVVYRCYMVWDKKIVVTIVPSLSVVAFLVTGIAAIRAFATDTTDTVFTGRTRTWISVMLCLTLFTKLMCFATVLAGTVLPRPDSAWHSVYLRVNRHEKHYKILLVGIESGALAVFGAIVLIPIYLSGRNAQGIMLAAMSPMTGESFLLIIMATLLGFTPSATGASRRRRLGGRLNTCVTIPPISPVTSPSSRFSAGTFNKGISPSTYTSAYPSTAADSDYSSKSFMKVSRTTEPALAFTESRYSRGYAYGEPLPFSTALVPCEPSLNAGSRETLPYGDGESIHISVSSRQEVNTIPERLTSAEPGAFPQGNDPDGPIVS